MSIWSYFTSFNFTHVMFILPVSAYVTLLEPFHPDSISCNPKLVVFILSHPFDPPTTEDVKHCQKISTDLSAMTLTAFSF